MANVERKESYTITVSKAEWDALYFAVERTVDWAFNYDDYRAETLDNIKDAMVKGRQS